MRILILLLTLFTSNGFAEIVFDKHNSAIVGRHNIRNFHVLRKVVDEHLLGSLYQESWAFRAFFAANEMHHNYFNNIYGIFSPTYFSHIIMHEGYGHRARANEFGLPAQISISYPGGLTLYGHEPSTHPMKHVMIDASGIEAQKLYGEHVLERAMTDQKMHYLDLLNYSFGSTAILSYFKYTDSELHKNSLANDLASYVSNLNTWTKGDANIDLTTIKSKARQDYFNPYLWLNLYTLYQFVVENQQTFDAPFFQFGSLGVMPLSSVSLAPYGLEQNYILYVKQNDGLIYKLGFRKGSFAKFNYYGYELKMLNIKLTNDLELCSELHYWRQPELFKEYAETKMKNGMAISNMMTYKVDQILRLKFGLSHKSSGYIPGEYASAGSFYRLGFAFNF